MYCSRCGSPLQPNQTVCSCGANYGSPAYGSVAAPGQSRTARNLQILAILWIIVGVLRLFPALMMFGVAGVLGASARMAPMGLHPHPMARLLGSGLFVVLGTLLGVTGLLALAAGWGLLKRRSWGRTLAIIMGILALIEIPLGTALGIYTLRVLLSANGEAEYRELTTR
jgi:hypothetical protein